LSRLLINVAIGGGVVQLTGAGPIMRRNKRLVPVRRHMPSAPEANQHVAVQRTVGLT